MTAKASEWRTFTAHIICGVFILPRNSLTFYPMIIYTSSTAQGGGGSFKNRKPIGEACCCGAKMAERTHWWIERWLCVSAFLSAVARTKQAAATPWGRHVGGMGRVTFLHVFLYFWRHDGARQHSGSRRFLSAVARTKLPRHREADTSEGWVTFLLVVVVAVAVVVEVRVVKLVKLVKLISVYFFDIFTSKKAQNPQFFTLLTSKCASRHNGVHFFDISTSKSAPRMVCFVHFHFEMYFAPQRRALFRHRNFQKWSAPLVLWPFWLGNVLRATTACTFSCLIWPAGSAPAALASLLFDPPEPQIIGKTQWIATFLSFRASTSSFFLSFLFSLPLPCSAFQLSILSEV